MISTSYLSCVYWLFFWCYLLTIHVMTSQSFFHSLSLDLCVCVCVRVFVYVWFFLYTQNCLTETMAINSQHSSENMSNRWTINSFFTDDQTLMVTAEKYLQQNMLNLARASKKIRSMLKKKTPKVITIAREGIPTKIFLDNQPLKQSTHFKQPGRTMHRQWKLTMG